MSADCSVFGEMKIRASIPTLEAERAQPSEERCEKHLAVNHPGCVVEAIGAEIYQAAAMILRSTGNDSTGRKIGSRGTTEEECGPMAGNEEE